MKKILLTFVLLVGIVAGLFAQKLTYQAVIRDNNQQLVVNTAVKATVAITFTSGAPYQAEFNGSTNLHGLLSIEFGDGSLVGRDWTGATIAVKVVNSATSSIVYVNDEPRPVSAVPYALSVNGVAIQQYLTEHKYVTEMQVGNQIHDSISNVVGKAHTHDNMTVLNATTAPYTDADSTKLKGIEAGAEVNVQSDWKQTDGSEDDYIKNKPSITDTVNNILSTGGYVTADALDSRHYLTSDSAVITTMQGHISTNKTNIQTNAGTISALTTKEQSDSLLLAGRIDALENASMDCNDVKDCIKDTLSKYTMTDVLNGLLQQLEARLTGKIDSLAHLVDSLSRLIPGGDTVKFICGTSKVKDVDNNEYNTVKIGNQCWMKENLRTTRYANGTSISNGGTNTSTSTAFRYFPNGDTSNVSIYGHLYNWTAVTKGASTTYPQNESDTLVHGICPDGWHVPSDAEFDTLTNYVNSVAEYRCGETDGAIANALSAATGWNTPEECGAGNNSTTLNKTGFSAVPAGYCNRANFNDFGYAAYFWSATQNGTAAAWIRNLFSNDSHASRDNRGKFLGFSVRCLKDEGGSSATLPTVTTTSVTNITHNSATSGGDVTADGGANVTARGVCWSTSQNPTIADSHTADGSGTGNFVSSITSLTSNTTYYVRAYATNSKGTAYGEEVSFTTISLPTVTTDSANTVTNNSATLHGNVTNMGGKDNVYAGFKYGTSESTLTSIVAKDAAMTATGLFSCDITGLTANTQYYFKAFVANGTDTVYGEVKNFTTAAAVFICGTDKVKDFDNNEYNTVKIGSQCWMKENLKTTSYADGTGIELGSSTSTETAYRYNPGNSSDNVSTYGYLYNRKAVMNTSSSSDANPSRVQGVCPTGWHVPSDAEWMQLTTYVNSVEDYKCNNEDNYIANALSIATGWQGSSECGAGGNSTTLNQTGFSAVPAGYYWYGRVMSFGYHAYFWSATQSGSNKPYSWYLYSGAVNVSRQERSMDDGCSVRCLRD